MVFVYFCRFCCLGNWFFFFQPVFALRTNFSTSFPACCHRSGNTFADSVRVSTGWFLFYNADGKSVPGSPRENYSTTNVTNPVQAVSLKLDLILRARHIFIIDGKATGYLSAYILFAVPEVIWKRRNLTRLCRNETT